MSIRAKRSDERLASRSTGLRDPTAFNLVILQTKSAEMKKIGVAFVVAAAMGSGVGIAQAMPVGLS
jgi:hypothetical protein